MKAVIFGADKVGIDFYFEIRAKEEVVAFIDNDTEKQKTEILGVRVLSAEKLQNLEFDRIYVASIYHFKEIEKQLKNLGIHQSKISFLPIQTDKEKKIPDMLYQFQEIYRKEEYDEEWKRIKERYECIKVYELCVDAIGEFITRFFMIQETYVESNALRVFIPYIPVKRICNKYLLDLLGRKIYIVQEKNAAFWAYVFREHLEEVDVSEYDKYSSVNDYPAYQTHDGDFKHCFHKDEIERGKMALGEMGMNKPYVCLAARTATYNERTIGHDFSYDFRNMLFDTYGAAIHYLQKQNMATVKMGRMEYPMKRLDGCVDYAGLYADDFKDLYLGSECEFMIANSTGIVFLARLFSKPVLMVNAVPVSFGFGGVRYTNQDLYIPKKYYDVNRDRYLSLREMMEVEAQCLIYGDRYEKAGIRFIDNTAEEIAAAVQEMFERLRGSWQDTEEDQKNYEVYLEIYRDMKTKTANNSDVWLGEPLAHRIAATYLRDNLYLLT